MASPSPKRQRDLLDRVLGFVVGLVVTAEIIAYLWACILSVYW